MTDLPPPRRPTQRASPWPFVGMIGMACNAFLIGASVLTTEWFVVVGLAVLWVAALVLALRWWTPHPLRLPLLPVGIAAVWLAAVVGGAALFGWS